MGNIVAVCISEKKGTAKQNVGTCRFIENWGLEKDAHACQEKVYLPECFMVVRFM